MLQRKALFGGVYVTLTLQTFVHLFSRDDPECVCVCVCMCVSVCVCARACLSVCLSLGLSLCLSLASDSSETVEVTIVKLGTVSASDMSMHHVLIILTFTFIQGHTYLSYEKCLTVSKTIHAITITFAVKIVPLRVFMTIASPMTLTFIQGHRCASNVSTS